MENNMWKRTHRQYRRLASGSVNIWKTNENNLSIVRREFTCETWQSAIAMFHFPTELKLCLPIWWFIFNSIQFNSIQFNSIQLNSIPFHLIQFNSIQFRCIHFALEHVLDEFTCSVSSKKIATPEHSFGRIS